MKELELRMYILVMYNLSEIQKGIQALHATVEYEKLYGNTKKYQRWSNQDKTVIVLDGGTSNDGIYSCYGEKPSLGTIQNHIKTLEENNIKYATFKEPDANCALTAVAFLVDERVFNKADYPDWETAELYFEKDTKSWKKLVGKKAIFLKKFLKNFKLA